MFTNVMNKYNAIEIIVSQICEQYDEREENGDEGNSELPHNLWTCLKKQKWAIYVNLPLYLVH